MFTAKCVLYCFIFISALQSVISIKCFNCRSDNDPKCADPFDNSTVPIKDCNHEDGLPHLPGVRPTMCRKIRQKVDGEWIYLRDCANLEEVGIKGDERFCVMQTGTDNIFIEHCTCNGKDGCNSSSTFAPAPLVFAVLLVLPYLGINLLS